jgi:hypothetical protein
MMEACLLCLAKLSARHTRMQLGAATVHTIWSGMRSTVSPWKATCEANSPKKGRLVAARPLWLPGWGCGEAGKQESRDTYRHVAAGLFVGSFIKPSTVSTESCEPQGRNGAHRGVRHGCGMKKGDHPVELGLAKTSTAAGEGVPPSSGGGLVTSKVPGPSSVQNPWKNRLRERALTASASIQTPCRRWHYNKQPQAGDKDCESRIGFLTS